MTSIDDVIRLLEAAKSSPSPSLAEKKEKKKKPRKAGPYQIEYKKQFKKFEKQNKKKSGGWKKDGFKRTQRLAHAATKKKVKK